jgi:N-acetylglutamate synthase
MRACSRRRPPRPCRVSNVADLALVLEVEQAALRAWPALEQWDDEGWLLRFADGYTKRANSVTPSQPCSEALVAKVARCEAIYRQRGLPPIFRLVGPLAPEELDAHLAGCGYALVDPTLVLSAPLAGLSLPIPQYPLHLTEDIDGWLCAYQAVSGTALPQAAHGSILGAIQGRLLLAALQAEGEPVACALAVVEDALVGLFDLAVAPAWRRQGLGRALMTGLIRWARNAGAQRAYLQLVKGNAPARGLYEGLGFSELYRYWYRVGPLQAPDRAE